MNPVMVFSAPDRPGRATGPERFDPSRRWENTGEREYIPKPTAHPRRESDGGMTFIRLLTRCLVVKEPRERVPAPTPAEGDGRRCDARFLH